MCQQYLHLLLFDVCRSHFYLCTITNASFMSLLINQRKRKKKKHMKRTVREEGGMEFKASPF